MKCKEAIELAEKINDLMAKYNAVGSYDNEATNYVNTPDGRSFIQRAYLMIMGKHLRGSCANCHMDAFIELAIFINNPNFKSIMESEYQFKNSMVFELVDNGTPITVTNHNITNDLAEKIIISCPVVADNMNKPEDWEKRIAKRIAAANETVTAEETEEVAETVTPKQQKKNRTPKA